MTQYNLAAIRELLAAAFSSSDIDTLAFDLFQEVYRNFSFGLPTTEKIKMVVTHADQQGQMPRLLAYAQKENRYQYNRFADRLQSEPVSPLPPDAMNQLHRQRLHDLEQNIQRSLTLLRQYERLFTAEDNPRKLLRYEDEIEREKQTIARYEQEAAALNTLMGEQPAAIQDNLDTLHQKLDALSHQLAEVDRKVTGGQVNIMAHLVRLDRQQHAHYLALTQRLDHNQLELVELLLDAADKQQIAQWDAASLTLMTQQALVDLHHLRQNQPDAAQWQSLATLLSGDAAWEQKLKLTIPLIPGLLAYETEGSLDILPTLREAWERLRNRLKRG